VTKSDKKRSQQQKITENDQKSRNAENVKIDKIRKTQKVTKMIK